ncbi:MAG: hypothetical protein NTV22_18635 [bacterium]|nr:hypothetical protein [bacterium]
MSPYEKLLAALLAAKVEFAVIGGLACALCGWSRATVDIDLLVRHERANIERVLACLRGYGTGAARELTPDDFTDEPGAIRVMEGFAIDVFVRIVGLSYDDLVADIALTDIDAGGIPLRVPHLNAQALIKIKSASVREQDRFDVSALRRIVAGERLDTQWPS